MRLTDFIIDVGRPIAYYPGLKKITKSTTATVFLCQLIYWIGKGSLPNGAIYKTSSEIEEETGLTYEEQKTARAKLVALGIIKEHYARLDHNIQFTVNVELLNDMWEASENGEHRANATMTNVALTNSLISNTETTTQTTTHCEKPISQTPPRSAEDIKQMTLNAITLGVKEHAQRQTDEIGHFPQDTLEVIRRVCEIWRLTPPRSSKDSRYAYWIRGARELRDACGEFGLGILDEIQEQWLDTGFLPSSPASLVKTATGLAGRHRVGEHALVVDKPEELSYHWNSEISPDENERLMKQARERAKSTQETNNDNISQDKMA